MTVRRAFPRTDVPRQLAARSWQSDPVPRLAVFISGREAPGAPGWTPAQPLPNGGRRIRRRRSYAIWPDLAASRPLIVARAQSCAEWFRRESVFNLSQVGRSGTRFFSVGSLFQQTATDSLRVRTLRRSTNARKFLLRRLKAAFRSEFWARARGLTEGLSSIDQAPGGLLASRFTERNSCHRRGTGTTTTN